MSLLFCLKSLFGWVSSLFHATAIIRIRKRFYGTKCIKFKRRILFEFSGNFQQTLLFEMRWTLQGGSRKMQMTAKDMWQQPVPPGEFHKPLQKRWGWLRGRSVKGQNKGHFSEAFVTFARVPVGDPCNTYCTLNFRGWGGCSSDLLQSADILECRVKRMWRVLRAFFKGTWAFTLVAQRRALVIRYLKHRHRK